MYLYSNKESNNDKFIEEFLEDDCGRYDEVPEKFLFALYEVEFEVEVDIGTGETKILKVDGKDLV